MKSPTGAVRPRNDPFGRRSGDGRIRHGRLCRYRNAAAGAVILLGLAACDDELDVSELDRSVVRVQHQLTANGRTFRGPHGTGFVLNKDGYVVTNHHVVDLTGKLPIGVKAVKLYVPDRSWKKQLTAKVIWSSAAYDLAVLKVEGLNRPPVLLASLDPGISPRKGDRVHAIGYPGAGDVMGAEAAIESTVTDGTVSKVAKGKGSRGGAARMIVQHSANINLGNSGGPLFDACGRVVAVNTYTAPSTFRLVRDRQGRISARGAAVSGIGYSPHVSALISVLTSEAALRNVFFRTTNVVCEPPKGTPFWLIGVVALAVLLALSSMVLAVLRKQGPREIVKLVESYSGWVRRKGHATAEDRTQRRGTGRRRTGPTGGHINEPDAGWVMSGVDTDGMPVRLVIGDTELKKASGGADKGIVIGRSNTMANKTLADSSVSRRHARLVLTEGVLAIEDLNSTYGTMVGETSLAPYTAHPIPDGATVKIGDVTLELHRL